MTEEEIKEWFDKWSDRHTLIEIVWGKKQSKTNTMSKQTAVEWLYEMLRDNHKEVFDGNIWEQAKAMEREQVETAFNAGTNFDAYRPGCPTGSTYYETMYEKCKTMITNLKDFFNFSKYKKK
jgi:hypothetical protein